MIDLASFIRIGRPADYTDTTRYTSYGYPIEHGACPTCGAGVGQLCSRRDGSGRLRAPHITRRRVAKRLP